MISFFQYFKYIFTIKFQGFLTFVASLYQNTVLIVPFKELKYCILRYFMGTE